MQYIFSEAAGLCNKSAAAPRPVFVPLWSRSGRETEANTPRGATLTPWSGGGAWLGMSVMALSQMPLTEPAGPSIVCAFAENQFVLVFLVRALYIDKSFISRRPGGADR